jgi:16S rRNA (guanine966-N2)-methyltransferase
VRVISGQAKGRPLKAVPGASTRPTTDKVKEALFSIIGPYFAGGNALDLFAGTGALGIEALSRGIDRAVFIDIERKSVEIIKHNLELTGLDVRAEVYRNDAARALKALAKRKLKFHLVFLDPPYKQKHMDELVQVMEQQSIFAEEAVVVIEHDASHSYGNRIGMLICERKAIYGETGVSVYRYQGSPPEEVEGVVTDGE